MIEQIKYSKTSEQQGYVDYYWGKLKHAHTHTLSRIVACIHTQDRRSLAADDKLIQSKELSCRNTDFPFKNCAMLPSENQ